MSVHPVVGVSDEVLLHHADQHPCPLDQTAVLVDCPCGQTLALVCRACHQPVFLAVKPGTWCDHVAVLHEAMS